MPGELAELREVGELLAQLREPEPPRGLRDAWDKLPLLRQILAMAPKHKAETRMSTGPMGPSCRHETARSSDDLWT